MHRIQLAGFTLCIAITFLTAAYCRADDPPTPACQLGRDLRAALGFGPQELAAMGVDEKSQIEIISIAEAYCVNNQDRITPLLDSIRTARHTVLHQYEAGADPSRAEQGLAVALSALSQATGDVSGALSNVLSTQQGASHARIIENGLVDPEIAVLELDSTQTEQLITARRERDQVLMHQRLRKCISRVNQAYDDYESLLARTLSPPQWMAYQNGHASIQAAILTAFQIQENACPQKNKGLGLLSIHGRPTARPVSWWTRLLDPWTGVFTGALILFSSVAAFVIKARMV